MENIIAQNEHVTLRELRTQISATSEGKLPTFKQLMEMKSAVVAQKVVNTALLTVYQNGYAVYEADGARTVMAVDRCKEYTYDFDNGTRITIQQELLENEEWSIRLLMEGEMRLEHNHNKTFDKFECVSLECDGSDWSAVASVDLQEHRARREAQPVCDQRCARGHPRRDHPRHGPRRDEDHRGLHRGLYRIKATLGITG